MRRETTKSPAQGRSLNPIKDESEDDAIRQSIAREIDEVFKYSAVVETTAAPDIEWVRIETSDFHMSDDAWERIGPRHALPDEARGRIDDRIRCFLAFERGMKDRDPATARSRLESAVKATDALIEALKSLPLEAVNALTLLEATARNHISANVNPLHMFDRMLLSRIEELEKLKGWLALGASRLVAKPSGDNASNRYWLASELDVLFHKYTGRRLDRSSKGSHTPRDFVAAVFKLADPRIGDGSIEQALREVQKHRAADDTPLGN